MNNNCPQVTSNTGEFFSMSQSNAAVPTPTLSAQPLNPYHLPTNPLNTNLNAPDKTFDTDSLTIL